MELRIKKKVKKHYNSMFDYYRDKSKMASKRYFVKILRFHGKGITTEYWHFALRR